MGTIQTGPSGRYKSNRSHDVIKQPPGYNSLQKPSLTEEVTGAAAGVAVTQNERQGNATGGQGTLLSGGLQSYNPTHGTPE